MSYKAMNRTEIFTALAAFAWFVLAVVYKEPVYHACSTAFQAALFVMLYIEKKDSKRYPIKFEIKGKDIEDGVPLFKKPPTPPRPADTIRRHG